MECLTSHCRVFDNLTLLVEVMNQLRPLINNDEMDNENGAAAVRGKQFKELQDQLSYYHVVQKNCLKDFGDHIERINDEFAKQGEK